MIEEITEKVKRPRMSLRKAINANCKSCIYDQYAGSGGWRQQVEACTSYQCSIYPVRPTQIKNPDDEDDIDEDDIDDIDEDEIVIDDE